MADASVEVIAPSGINITFTGAGGDWDSKTSFPGGLKVKSIKFFPSAANDILVVRDGSVTGPIMAKMKDTTGGGSADVGFGDGVWMYPYIKYADCTFNTGTSVIVMFNLA